MTKEMFLRELSRKLHQLPEKELKQQLSYYEELLNDMMEDGITEEDAIYKLGDIQEIVEEILQEQPITTLVKTKVRPRNGWTIAAIIVVVLGSPLWIPLLLAFLLTIGAVIISGAAITVSLGLCTAAFGCVGVFWVIRGFCLFASNISYAVFGIGAGLITLGLTCMAMLTVKYTVIALYKGGRWLYRKVKSLLVVKGA